METADCELLWQQIHERNSSAARAIDPVKHSELAKRALQEAADFSALVLPISGHELNLRRVASNTMTANWAAEAARLNAL